MDKVTYKLVHNRKNKLNAKGEAIIQVEAYANGLRKYFSTKICISPDTWNNKKQQIKTHHPNAHSLNKQIYDFISELEDFELECKRTDKPFSLDILKNYANGNKSNSFTDFMNTEIEKSTLTYRTIQSHRTTLNRLKVFKNNILFTELSFELLSNFEKYLHGLNLDTNTIYKYFKIIRKYTNLAINYNLFEQNKYPFRTFKLKQKDGTRTYLTIEEMQAVENVEMPTDKNHLTTIKDMFLFACYTGLRYSDVTRLTPANIVNNNGEKWLTISMQKTEKPVQLPLEKLHNGKPIDILNKYSNGVDKLYFNNLTNQYVNRCLKEIATFAKIDKILTFHMARHTAATFLLTKGLPITTIKSILGHTKIQTTEIYSKVLNATISSELAAIKY